MQLFRVYHTYINTTFPHVKLLKKNANCHIIIQLIKTDGLPNSFGTNISRGIMERNVNIIKDVNENQIAVINDIRFKGKRSIDWNDVEQYMKQYVGEFIEIADSKEIIYIGSDFPDEYTSSNYTAKLKGALAKAKANATQGIPEIVEIAKNKRFQENMAKKHDKNAKFGWYRYDSRFAIPIFNEMNDFLRYNVFCAELVIRHSENRKLYLYDIINLKKETSTPLEQ